MPSRGSELFQLILLELHLPTASVLTFLPSMAFGQPSLRERRHVDLRAACTFLAVEATK